MIVGEQHLQLAAPKAVHPLLYQYVPILESAARRAEVVSSRTGNAFRLGVTSMETGTGVSTLAANLALAAVKIVRRGTTLVEANLLRTSMMDSFDAEFDGKAECPGFGDAVLGLCEAEEVIHPSLTAGLSLVPGGNAKTARQLSEATDVALETTLSKIQSDENWLVVDLPPSSGPFTQAVAACLDGVILLVYGNHTSRVRLNQVVGGYAKLGIPVLGTVYRHMSP